MSEGPFDDGVLYDSVSVIVVSLTGRRDEFGDFVRAAVLPKVLTEPDTPRGVRDLLGYLGEIANEIEGARQALREHYENQGWTE